MHDASLLSHKSGRYTSFLQVRGSVPLYWQQEVNSIKAKRPISIARADPYATLASMHFERVRVAAQSTALGQGDERVCACVYQRSEASHVMCFMRDCVIDCSFCTGTAPP